MRKFRRIDFSSSNLQLRDDGEIFLRRKLETKYYNTPGKSVVFPGTQLLLVCFVRKCHGHLLCIVLIPRLVQYYHLLRLCGQYLLTSAECSASIPVGESWAMGESVTLSPAFTAGFGSISKTASKRPDRPTDRQTDRQTGR